MMQISCIHSFILPSKIVIIAYPLAGILQGSEDTLINERKRERDRERQRENLFCLVSYLLLGACFPTRLYIL